MATNRGFGFINEGVYHIFNRGVERRPVFTDVKEYQHFVDALWFYRFPHKLRLSFFFALSAAERQLFRHSLEDQEQNKSITLLAYCLMPNHFHLIVKQNQKTGVTSFVANITNSYTKYFNTKHKRPGSLFQGPFKAVRVETDEQLLHLSRYVHINPITAGIIQADALSKYKWSSFPEYENQNVPSLCETTWMTEFFSIRAKYKQFLLDNVDFGKKLEAIKHLALEEIQ